MKLTRKFLLLIALSFGIVIIPFGFSEIKRTHEQIKIQSETDLHAFITTISKALAESLWNYDASTVKQLISSMVQKDTVLQVEIYDDEGRFLQGVKKDFVLNAKFSEVATPVLKLDSMQTTKEVGFYKTTAFSNNEQLIVSTLWKDNANQHFRGHIHVLVETSHIQKQLTEFITRTILAIAVLMFSTGGLIFYFTRNEIIRPIQKISDSMNKAATDLSVRVALDKNRKDEIYELGHGFNSMLDSMQVSQKLIDEQQHQILASSKFSALGEMAAGIAHEINNPLAIISGIATTAVDEITDGNIDSAFLQAQFEKIDKTCHRISKIVRGLKTFARNAENDPFAPVALHSLIEHTLTMCEQRFRNGAVAIKIKDDFNPEISCREVQLSQVILNLFNNAYDAIENLPHPRWVELSTQLTATHFNIYITDCGGGIPKEIADKIMQPFYTTKEVGKGTGLGLSISRKIIEQHGGNLYIDTKCKNTRFVIELPLERIIDKKQAA